MKMKLASLLIFLMAFSQTPVLAVGVGHENSFFGRDAGASNIEGDNNSFLGSRAGYSNIQGNSNSFFGRDAGASNIEGDNNSFFGSRAGYSNTLGNSNSFFGWRAGLHNTKGYNNSFFGSRAGYLNIEGDNNVFLGHHAGYYETGSNKLYISISDTSTPLIYGEFDNQYLLINGSLSVQENIGIGITDPSHLIELSGGAYSDGTSWVNASSKEVKDDINDLSVSAALETLERLNPVTFKYKQDLEKTKVGFIAEDVPELVATKDRKGLSSMDIVAVLTKVVQEQQKMTLELQKTVQEQQVKIGQLETALQFKQDKNADLVQMDISQTSVK